MGSGQGSEPNVISYYFETEGLKGIKNGLKECDEKLGEYGARLDKFFKGKPGYNNEQIATEFGIEEKKVVELLQWYARRELGQKIEACVKKYGECSFDAEL